MFSNILRLKRQVNPANGYHLKQLKNSELSVPGNIFNNNKTVCKIFLRYIPNCQNNNALYFDSKNFLHEIFDQD